MNNVLITTTSMSIGGGIKSGGGSNEPSGEDNKTSIEDKFIIGLFITVFLISLSLLIALIAPSSLYDKTYIITGKGIAIGKTVDKAEYIKVYDNTNYIYAREINKQKGLLFNVTNIYSDKELTKFYCYDDIYYNKHVRDTIVVSKWFVKWRYKLSMGDLVNK